MKIASLILPSLLLSSPALGAEMTIDFSFQGGGCVTLFANPEIHLKDVPNGAKSVLVMLTQRDRELGDQEVPLSGTVIAARAVTTFSPCNPGFYEYTVVVKSASGAVLGEAKQSRPYPGSPN